MDCVYDAQAAADAVLFFESLLRHSKGAFAGKPFALAGWQRTGVVEPLFGWKRRDGTRRYRTAFVAVPRKNGKSTLAAGLALHGLLADREPGAEVYSCAADRDQARIVFAEARAMVLQSPELARRCKVYQYAIEAIASAGVYRVISADAYTKHGLNASRIIFDELHAQRNRDLWDVMTTAVGSRRQPLMIALTTAGYDRHSICREVWDYAVRVRDGIVRDDTFLPVVYAAPDGADWKSPATWAAANPNLGVSLSPDYLQSEAKLAAELPARENIFRRLHLNQWTEQATRWIDLELWDAGGAPFDPPSLRGRPCCAGLDLSSTADLTALVLAYPPASDEEVWHVVPYYWVPGESAITRERIDRVPYPTWAQTGHVTFTGGRNVDYSAVRAKLRELRETGEDIRKIAVDPWNARHVNKQLEEDGFEIVEFGQGFASMSGASKAFEGLVGARRLRHGGHPVLRWNAANVVVEQDAAGNIKPHKGRSGDRIDGIIAAIMAIAVAADEPCEPQHSGPLAVWV